MLTCKNLDALTAREYFKEGYYQNGRWSGFGALALGLTGEMADPTAYENLLEGLSPDGKKQLTGKKVPVEGRRAAMDCTFSAPKSVSLTALVGGDERLIEAHRTAVQQTLTLIENRYAQTRILEKGSPRKVVNTNSLVVAQYDHIETRELDPHLHTHCVVINLTQLEDGRWRSLHNDAIYRNKKLLGMAYQHYLALEVEKLGYTVEPKEHGQFEISGYREEDLMDFSKRRQQILEAVGANNSRTERDRAWRATRKGKVIVAPEELKAKWIEQAQALGITFVQPGTPQPIPETPINQQSLDDAIEHCSERTVAFKQEEIEKFILSEGLPMDVTKIEKAISKRSASRCASHKELIRTPEKGQVRFTTQSALQRELATLNLMQQGQGKVTPLEDPETVEEFLKAQSFTQGQKEAIASAATTT
ncbi:MAG: MobF family relaxase, partial [Microcystaceae cyanobacterium]